MYKRNAISILIWLIILLVFSIVNLFCGVILIPELDDVVQMEINIITISTVFIGFAFTSLGILLGMSSEKLIQRIKDTDILMQKVLMVVDSIVFLLISIAVSLYYMLGFNRFLFNEEIILGKADQFIYVVGIDSLVVGIVYFAKSIYELYDLIKRIYEYSIDRNLIESNDRALGQIENVREKIEKADYED